MKTKRYLATTKTNGSTTRKRLKYGKRLNNFMVLTITTTIIHTVTGLLKMPRTIGEKALRASEISKAAAVSTQVVTPAGVITALNTKITAYRKAAPNARPAAELEMMKALNAILRNYQTAAENNPANALNIFASGTFGTKGYGGRAKQGFKVCNGAVSGTVILTAQGGGNYCCHVWKYSMDGENWNWIIPTIVAKAVIENLPAEQTVYFTHELVNSKGPHGVSQIFKLMIS